MAIQLSSPAHGALFRWSDKVLFGSCCPKGARPHIPRNPVLQAQDAFPLHQTPRTKARPAQKSSSQNPHSPRPASLFLPIHQSHCQAQEGSTKDQVHTGRSLGRESPASFKVTLSEGWQKPTSVSVLLGADTNTHTLRLSGSDVQSGLWHMLPLPG